MIKKIGSIFTATVLLTAMWSCGGDKTTDNNTETKTDTLAKDSTGGEEEMQEGDQTSYLLPSPLQIAYIFKKSGLKYVAGTTHDVKKQADYSTSYSQSLALGVYSSDLAYCVLNKEKQEAINYMNAVKALSDKLGMSTVFDSETLLKRFEANIGNEDSIMFILSEIQSKSDEFFSSNDRQMSAAIVFSGAWVESMYIASHVLPKTKDSKLASQLADQMGILENLIKELKRHESKDTNIGGLLTNLNAIHDIIAGIPGVKEMMDSDKPSEVKIDASEQQLKDLAKKLEEVRMMIIKG
jgi:chaperonin cofactor prefoldin